MTDKVISMIYEIMNGANISQYELSRRSKIDRNTINRYVCGVHIPRVDTFMRMCEACGYEIVLRKR